MNINQIIKSSIIDNKPISFGKMGNVEAMHALSFANNQPRLFGSFLHSSAGIFTPSIDEFNDWCSSFLEAVTDLDYILQWSPQKEDEEIINNVTHNKNVFNDFEGLEPFVFGKEGWHHSLSDKKVLCVSPFSDTIKNQIKKFDKIWDGAKVKELATVTSRFSEHWTGDKPIPWRQKLDSMLSEIDKLDFDFATVGCGGLSLHICQHIKAMGKPCVHLGGGNQILYGVRGKRWDDWFKQHNWYGTKDWIRPMPHEVPPYHGTMEFGCYW